MTAPCVAVSDTCSSFAATDATPQQADVYRESIGPTNQQDTGVKWTVSLPSINVVLYASVKQNGRDGKRGVELHKK